MLHQERADGYARQWLVQLQLQHLKVDVYFLSF